MSLSRDITTFTDVHKTLDHALHSDRGVAMVFHSPAAALYFRQRACRYRVLFRKRYAECPYDDLTLSVYGAELLITKSLKPLVQEL